MDPLRPSGPPIIFNFSEIDAVPTPRPAGTHDPTHLDFDYELSNYFVDARDMGKGPLTPRMSFTEAVRRFII